MLLVSIPLRKVSRHEPEEDQHFQASSFHPSKEGFKAISHIDALLKKGSFHPSKEGFKG